MAKKKYTKVFIDGKRVKITDCYKIKGFKFIHDRLKACTFMPGSSGIQEVNLSNGKKLKIIVKDNRKPI